MTGLIPVYSRFIAGESTHTVSARQLHEFLGVRRVFSTWILNRIRRGRFVENQDFNLIHQNGCIKKHGGDRRSKDYWLTLDMAKMLGMLENNDKGDQVRTYFLDCEKQLQAKHKQEQPDLPAPVVKERILLWLENGQIKHTTTVPDNAYIATPDQLPEVVAKELPGMILIDRHHYEELNRKTEGMIAALQFAILFREDLQELLRSHDS